MRLHPAVEFVFFAAVLVCSMLFLHPVFLALSFLGAVLYAVRLNGGRALRFCLVGALPLMLFAALLNALFNHQGFTVLLYLNDNPLTLEALAFGGATAAMLGAVLLWFSCFNAVMTSEKLIFLFGRLFPSLSLALCMVLRFVPRFSAQARRVNAAQRGVGRGISSGNFWQRARHGARELSILTTWSLENGIDTADSMRSRGYGLRGRTHYANYRFTPRDGAALAVVLALFLAAVSAPVFGRAGASYFPVLSFGGGVWASVSFAAYGLLCLFPLALNLSDRCDR